MKTFFLLVFSLTTAWAQFAGAAKAEDQDQAKPPKKQQQQAPPRQPPVAKPAPKFQPSASVRQQTPVYRPPQFKPAPTNQAPQVRSWKQDAPRPIRPTQNSEMVQRPRPSPGVVTTPPGTTAVQPNVNGRKHSDWDNRNDVDRNWRNRHSHCSWEEARRRHRRVHHHRHWWSSHYNRFALFCGGYYFWDGGYWYPAYGYHPAYNVYTYVEPIYGYNDLDPAQVVSTVQAELQRLGYYRDAVDGWMGPNTRAALADYQRDNGLAITAAIDGPTLQSLGLE